MAIKDGDKLPQVNGDSILAIDSNQSNGLLYGATTIQKVGFHGVTPAIQRTSSSQAAISASTNATLSDVPTATYTSVEQTAIQNCINAINAMKTVVDAEKVLVNELRAALVEKGLIKGS